MALAINESNFDEMVASAEKPVVLDFWAEWCGPCRMVSPLIDEISTEYADKAIIGKVDVDSNNELSTKFGVRNIPTVLFIKGGKVVDKVVGAVPKSTLTAKLDAIL